MQWVERNIHYWHWLIYIGCWIFNSWYITIYSGTFVATTLNSSRMWHFSRRIEIWNAFFFTKISIRYHSQKQLRDISKSPYCARMHKSFCPRSNYTTENTKIVDFFCIEYLYFFFLVPCTFSRRDIKCCIYSYDFDVRCMHNSCTETLSYVAWYWRMVLHLLLAQALPGRRSAYSFERMFLIFPSMGQSNTKHFQDLCSVYKYIITRTACISR